MKLKAERRSANILWESRQVATLSQLPRKLLTFECSVFAQRLCICRGRCFKAIVSAANCLRGSRISKVQ
jgi:hypothetical protein